MSTRRRWRFLPWIFFLPPSYPHVARHRPRWSWLTGRRRCPRWALGSCPSEPPQAPLARRSVEPLEGALDAPPPPEPVMDRVLQGGKPRGKRAARGSPALEHVGRRVEVLARALCSFGRRPRLGFSRAGRWALRHSHSVSDRSVGYLLLLTVLIRRRSVGRRFIQPIYQTGSKGRGLLGSCQENFLENSKLCGHERAGA